MFDDQEALSTTISGWRWGAINRTNNACWFESCDWDAEREGGHGQSDGEPDESIINFLKDWSSGVVLATMWCRDCDRFIEEQIQRKENGQATAGDTGETINQTIKRLAGRGA